MEIQACEHNATSIIVNSCHSSDSIALDSAFYGTGSGYIALDEVRCTGYEDRLIDCVSNALGDNDCSHFEDASVICSQTSSSKFSR